MTAILIALDLSARSDRALQRGLSIASELNSAVSLVSIVDDSMPKHMVDDIMAKTRDHLTASLQETNRNIECSVIVESGDPVERLTEVANDAKYDLVVLGLHRKRAFLDYIWQTTMERIISLTFKPVLLASVPVHGPYKRVLAPVAFSRACKSAVEVAARIAPEAGFKLIHSWLAPFEGMTRGGTSGYVNSFERECAQQARDWATNLPDGLPPVELRHGSVGTTFFREVQDTSPDLIAVGAHTRSTSFTGVGPFTAELVRDPPADLLVVKGHPHRGL